MINSDIGGGCPRQQLTCALSQAAGLPTDHGASTDALTIGTMDYPSEPALKMVARAAMQARQVSLTALAERGVVSWDGLVDTQLRGAIARGSIFAVSALIAWAYLALPWYAEPHGSTAENAPFIADLVAFAGLDELAALEAHLAMRSSSLRSPVDALPAFGSWKTQSCSEEGPAKWPGITRHPGAAKVTARAPIPSTAPTAMSSISPRLRRH